MTKQMNPKFSAEQYAVKHWTRWYHTDFQLP